MNKVITDGLVLMPPPFADGLDVWSSGDRTPRSDTYEQSGNGAFVPADADFAGALEIVKTSSVTKLRYIGETSILPGCYLKVTVLVRGNGVGREIYVSDVDIATNTISLNAQLYDAIGTQEFTFMRFKYMLDFSGFTKMSDMIFDHNEFACGVNLAV